jgi:hypothetical protein
MKKLTLKFLENAVHRLDPKIKSEDSSFKTAVLLLSALQVGANINRLVKFTGYPKNFVRERAQRCRQNGIFQGGKVACEWFDKDNGGIGLRCDVLVAEGVLERSTETARA